ncbi:unnamed protein product [Adineta steineri]|uniref:SWIM-type domain-containing protein n=2 Tax=Adineta steineri TaxID=433720 RepID=A0A815VK54_9BILA|nr:unnamed protein product [Adineta steineri]
MTFLVPINPKNRTCISCGVKVGFAMKRKRDKRIKLAHYVGRTKQIEIFSLFNIVTDHNHHMLCTNCFGKNVKELNIYTENQANKPYMYDELIQHAVIYNNKLLASTGMKDSNYHCISIYDMSIEDCTRLSGLFPDSIYDIAKSIHQDPQLILEFFTICRQNMNHRAAAVCFGYKSNSSISLHFTKIFTSLLNDFVPKYIGYTAFTRKDVKRKTPELFKKLFPNVVGIIDGTYFYCQKAECFEIQRKTWSEQKKRNLVEAMGIQFADGTWFDLIGPFYADGDHNDASIWNYIVEEDIGNIHDIFNEETDEFLGDRGFRDVDDERFTVLIPFSLNKGQIQLPTRSANTTRKIAKLRNSIERGFGRLKQWKIINAVIDTNLISKFGSLLRILGAIDNKYFQPLSMATNIDRQKINYIKHREAVPNILENLPKNQWIKKQLDEITDLIPKLTLDIIRNYALGEYALKLAIPYLQHASSLSIKTHKSKQYEGILKIEGITSRFSKCISPKHHKVFIQFNNSNQPKQSTRTYDDNSNDGLSINIKNINSYCTCKSGARTVGTCAHVIAVLYWLYANLNGITIPTYNVKSTALEQNITNLQPFNRRRREQKLINDETTMSDITDSDIINNDITDSEDEEYL